jgi:hypothetical protein
MLSIEYADAQMETPFEDVKDTISGVFACFSIESSIGRGRIATRYSIHQARVKSAGKLGAWTFSGPKEA